jgi:peptidoglycan/xylan/chitin deacetylase (PgdA/CDA1 family)
MSTRHRVLSALRNPLVIVPPLVIVLGVGWHDYTFAGRALSLPITNLNLLPDSAFNVFEANGLPLGWQVNLHGDLHYSVSQANGYATGKSVQIAVQAYQSGDVTLASPKVAIHPNTTYLFKSYYNAGTPLTLLARQYNADGSSTLQLIQTYPANNSWSTVSDAFKAGASTTAVQFVLQLSADGSASVNNPYLEPQQDVYVAPPASGPNVIPNGELSPGSYDTPDSWLTYDTGQNTVNFSYIQNGGQPYVQTTIHNYKNGQAKWQYAPQSVIPDQYYSLSLTYQANIPVLVVAEYVLQDGTRQDQTVVTLPPSGDWTTAINRFQVPPGATNMFISLPLQSDGTVASRDYTLINTTKSGPLRWSQPLVSVTFDDGWQATYDAALPVLRQYGYTGTFYVSPSTIETAGFMTASELDTLANDGDEIGTNGYNPEDLTAINDSALSYQLREGRDYLDTAGFSVTDLATPYGRSDAGVQWYARQYYTTIRSSDAGINTRQNLDPYDLKVLYVTNDTTPQDVNIALQATKAENGWLLLVYHRITNDPNAPYGSANVEHVSTMTSAFKKQMAQVAASNIKVLPVAAAYAALQHE